MEASSSSHDTCYTSIINYVNLYWSLFISIHVVECLLGVFHILTCDSNLYFQQFFFRDSSTVINSYFILEKLAIWWIIALWMLFIVWFMDMKIICRMQFWIINYLNIMLCSCCTRKKWRVSFSILELKSFDIK